MKIFTTIPETYSIQTKLKILLHHHEQMYERVQHFEKLLLSFAALGLAGWGYLYTYFSTLSDKSTMDPEYIRVATVIIFFSGLMCSAYNGLYIARNRFNAIIFQIEGKISRYKAHLSYFNGNIAQPIFTFLLTAMFIPFASFTSLSIQAYEIYYAIIEVENFDPLGSWAFVVYLWIIMTFFGLLTTIMCGHSIFSVFNTWKKINKNSDESLTIVEQEENIPIQKAFADLIDKKSKE